MHLPRPHGAALTLGLTLAAIAVVPVALEAQSATPSVTPSAARRAMTPADISAWKSIRGATLSSDGAWFAHLLAPNEGDAEVVVRQTTAGGKVLRFPIGEPPANGGAPVMAADGRWVAMLVYPKAAEQKKLRQQRRPIVSRALVVNLATGEQREFDRIRRIAFGGEAPKYIAMQAFGPDAPAGGGGAAGGPAPGAPGMGGNLMGGGPRVDGTDLLLHELGTSAVFNIGNVSDFAFDEAGHQLAYAIEAREQVGNGVQLRDLTTGVVKSLDAGKAFYRRLAWSDTLNALAFLKGVADSANTDTTWTAIGVSRIGTPAPQRVVVGAGGPVALPNGMEISPDRTPRWTDALDGLVIGLRVAAPPVPKSEQLDDDDRPTLILWHHKDPRLQSMQLVQEQADRGFSFVATYLPASQKVVQLTDDVVRTGSLGGRDAWLLGTDSSPYERQSSVDGIQRRDIYVVNARTGEKTLVKQDARSVPQLSPDGRTVAFWDDGHWQAFDIATKGTTNLTKGAPVSFIDTEDDHNVDRPATQFLGFSKDGKFVLLQDNYDVWRVSLTGTQFTNLTVDGKAKRIRYARRIVTDARERGIDLTKPLYMAALQARTKKEAIVRIDPARAGAVALTGWREARHLPMKAKSADVWVASIQTASRFPDYWRISYGAGALADSVRLTDANPGMNGVAWSSGSRLVDYVTEKGDSLQGVLVLPANYEPGKQYPTLTFIYELQSDNLHTFWAPNFSSSPNALIGVHASRGYAVFLPDIVYKINDPGMSAVWSVVPAVKAAIRTGVVDSTNVGLHGHSWGGYQTSFLVTQTNIFKSAVAGAPLTDMISMYSSVYWNTGSANQGIFQSSQGRFKGNFLDHREAYERNSPNRFADKVKTPLIILHDDKDGAVDFNQGITYYNTLRQLGKDVILLEYVGENHGLAQLKNRRDYSLRLMEYWDSYLKGQPAPEWLRNGIPRLKMEEHLREMKKKAEGKNIAM